MDRMKGKVAVVTGAASGIGRASAKLFAAEGASVLAVDRVDAVHDTAKAIEKAGGKGISATADASSESDVAKMVERAVKEFGKLDALYANAGVIGNNKPFLELDLDDWNSVLAVNTIGVYWAIKHAAKAMIPNRAGSIVCTASIAGVNASGATPPYSVSKAGVISLVKDSANFLADTGIRVNAICPGIIETGMTKFMFDRAKARGTNAKIGQYTPLRRYGHPEEIAHMALFLASDDSSYVNGQAFAVDGGMTSALPGTLRAPK